MLKILSVLFAARQRGVVDGAATPTAPNPGKHKGEPRLPFNVSLRALFIIEGWSIVVFGTHPLLRFLAIPIRDQEQT